MSVGSKAEEDDSYPDAYCASYCYNEQLHRVLIQIAKKHKGDSTLFLVRHVHHGEEVFMNLADMRDVHPAWVCADNTIDEIKEALAEFEAGECTDLIASGIFVGGIDFPEIDVLVLATGDVAPSKSRLGRGLRKKNAEGKALLVYDFYIEPHPEVLRRFEKREKGYTAEGLGIVRYIGRDFRA
jgi:superfamily II DNA or RNA helicase